MKPDRDSILEYHLGGKIAVQPSKRLFDQRTLSMAYTPGVALPVREIHEHPERVRDLTAKSNLVAVVTDGSAILGLGDLGATASIPVMEGKAVLFKSFADVDAWPVPLENCRIGGKPTGKTDPALVIETCCRLACMYGGINLEDIAAPTCFEIEDKLDRMLDIPVFHDDQWGTAVITMAGVINYALLCDRKINELQIVINGAGAAGIRIADMLKELGVGQLIICDSKGVISQDRKDLNGMKQKHAIKTGMKTLSDAIRGAHVFIGVSAADCLSGDDVRSMAPYPAVFAMANPDPEITAEAVAAILGDKPYIMATGRSDYPNQINNVLGFPYLFRGALDVRASTINAEMKIAAANALAELARKPATGHLKKLYNREYEFGPEYIVPNPFDRRLFVDIPLAVAKAAVATGVSARADIANYAQELEDREQLTVGSVSVYR